MFEALLNHIIILTGLAVLIAVASGIGRLVLPKTEGFLIIYGQAFLFSTGLGLAVLSYSVFMLSALQILNRPILYILSGVFCVSGLLGWRILLRELKDSIQSKAVLSVPDRWFGAALLAGALLCMILAFTPAVAKDSLSYHLAVPKLYLMNEGFYFIPGNYFSNYPLFGEMLFLIGLFLHGDILAKCIQFSIFLLVLIAMWQYMKQHLKEIPTRTLPLLVFLSIPSVFATSHLAYTDLILTLYAFLAVFAYTKWFEVLDTRWLILSAVFTGIAVSTKYAGLILPLIGSLGIIVASHRHQIATSTTFTNLALYWALTILIGCPFYIKNLVLTGNPLYPLFFEVFGGKGWDDELTRIHDIFLKHLGMGRAFWDYVRLPWNLSFHARMNSPEFDGMLGPIFITTLPFLVVIRKIPTAIRIGLVFSGFMFLFWAASAQQMRYLIPIFPFLSIVVGYIVSRYNKGTVAHTILLCTIAISMGINGYHIVTEYRRINPLPYIVGKDNRDAFLERHIPSYSMFRYVNSRLPERANLFFIYMRNYGYLCNRTFYSDSMFEAHTIQNILRRASKPEDVYEALKEKRFTHILYDGQYVLGNLSPLTANEKSLFVAFQKKHLELLKAEKQRYFLYRVTE